MRVVRLWPALLLLAGCAGIERDCSSWWASDVGGADWIVVQYRFDGEPINCWQLRDTGITNESHADGIFWRAESEHLVHISGWYDRVQVDRHDYASAAKQVGIDLARCEGGRYRPAPPPQVTIDATVIYADGGPP
jgi:hypothetical protein